MRRFKHLILIVAALFGFFAGDSLGVITPTLLDWDSGLDHEFAMSIYRYDAIILGLCVAISMLAADQLVKVGDFNLIGIALVLAVMYHMAIFAKTGDLLSFFPYRSLLGFLFPFFIGVLSGFGARFLIRELVSRRLGEGDT